MPGGKKAQKSQNGIGATEAPSLMPQRPGAHPVKEWAPHSIAPACCVRAGNGERTEEKRRPLPAGAALSPRAASVQRRPPALQPL